MMTLTKGELSEKPKRFWHWRDVGGLLNDTMGEQWDA